MYRDAIIIRKVDLEYLTTFKCEHHRDVGDKDNCFNHPEQGGCCNSCWVRKMAKDYLKGEN